MNLPEEDHVVRYVPYGRLQRDKDDNVIGVLPQAFELRLDKDEKYLSVNWLEFFKGDREFNLKETVNMFKDAMENLGARVATKSAFCIGNTGKILDTCVACNFTKVRIVYDTPHKNNPNKSHSKIMHLPENDTVLLDLFADEVFNDVVLYADVPKV